MGCKFILISWSLYVKKYSFSLISVFPLISSSQLLLCSSACCRSLSCQSKAVTLLRGVTRSWSSMRSAWSAVITCCWRTYLFDSEEKDASGCKSKEILHLCWMDGIEWLVSSVIYTSSGHQLPFQGCLVSRALSAMMCEMKAEENQGLLLEGVLCPSLLLFSQSPVESPCDSLEQLVGCVADGSRLWKQSRCLGQCPIFMTFFDKRSIFCKSGAVPTAVSLSGPSCKEL